MRRDFTAGYVSLNGKLDRLRATEGSVFPSHVAPRRIYRLDRALRQRLAHRIGAAARIRIVVGLIVREMRAHGTADAMILESFARLVEHTAYSAPEQKISLLTGKPEWLTVQSEVVEFARLELCSGSE